MVRRFPLKLTAVSVHEGWRVVPRLLPSPGTDDGCECSHGIAGTLTGAKVESLILDPNQGGSTRMVGGWAFVSLPAGCAFDSTRLSRRRAGSGGSLTGTTLSDPRTDIGSTVIGAALIFAGFDQKASKIACVALATERARRCDGRRGTDGSVAARSRSLSTSRSSPTGLARLGSRCST